MKSSFLIPVRYFHIGFLLIVCACFCKVSLLYSQLQGNSLKEYLTGNNFSKWREKTGTWEINGDVQLDPENNKLMKSFPGTGILINGRDGKTVPLISRKEFGDVQTHIEFMIPKDSNSGIYFMGRYELQVYDSWQKESEYPGIECGGIYQRWDEKKTPKGFEGHSPKINASLPPGQWQWFDVIFRAPRFDKSGNKIANAKFEKVFHNGMLIHENIELTGPTRGSLSDDEKSVGPLLLQGDHGPVAYRNIRITPADVNPFYAMDTGTKDENHQSPREQVEMLKELGYDGIDHMGCENLPVLVEELDKNSMRLFAIYLNVWIEKDSVKYNPGLPEAIKLLKNRDVILWVPINSKTFQKSSQDGDIQAVKVVQEIADMAVESELKVALYPHFGCWIERIEDAVRVVKKVDRKNVGVTFNLCHWLRVGDETNLELRVKMALPHLFVVTINGADHTGDWKQLIQPLDSGSFDVYNFIKTLREYGYNGPIGLQGYGIGGNVFQNLDRSMKAWQKINGRLLGEMSRR